MNWRLPFTAFAVDLAREAGDRLLAALPEIMEAKQVRFKGPTDLVTRADHDVERFIAARLAETFPDHALLAEEGSTRPGTGPRWIVDPLDGTTNFVHGLPWFSVSIALEIDGHIELGVVCHPAVGEVFAAERGGGAWLMTHGRDLRSLRVSATTDLGSALLSTGLPGAERRMRQLIHIPRVAEQTREVRIMGSAAIHLASVAAGRLEGFWEPGLNPWDVAAGALLVEEARGIVTGMGGEPFSRRDTLATNGHIHQAMIDLLREGPEDPPPGEWRG